MYLLLILSLMINITSSGVPVVHVDVMPYTDVPLINITLPVHPVPNTVLAVNSCDKSMVPLRVLDDRVLMPSSTCVTHLTYYGDVAIRDYTFTLSVDSERPVLIAISENIVLLSVERALVRGNVIELPPGRHNISYVVLPALITPTRPVQTTTGTAEITSPAYVNAYLIYAIAATIAAIAAGLLALRIRRRRLSVGLREHERLRDIDYKILEIIRMHGNSIMQSELQRALCIPKTTLWRAIRRLERYNYVRIEKVDGMNKIVLIRG